MNIRGYLGLDNAYAYTLLENPKNLKGPYVVDERLRETPIVPDYSFNINLKTGTAICNYFMPIKSAKHPAFIQLSKEEFKYYNYLRSNAFYTPYGMMILLDNGSLFSKSFVLENLDLVPKTRKIEIITSSFNAMKHTHEHYATFFADFVMENIILYNFNESIAIRGEDHFTQIKKIRPILMKNFRPFKEVPIYDVQFHDLIAFADQFSYDTYMVSLTSCLSGNKISGDDLYIRFNPRYRLFKCYPKEYISSSLKGGRNALMIYALDEIWDDPMSELTYEEKREKSYEIMKNYL